MKILVLLLLVALISKEIVVFNEEFLILIAFSLFIVVLIRTLKNTVVQEFDSRAQVIARDFELANKYKEQLLEQSIANSSKEATLTGPLLQNLLSTTIETIKRIHTNTKKEIKILLRQQIESKIDRLRVIEFQELALYKKQLLNKMLQNRIRKFLVLSSLKAKKLINAARSTNKALASPALAISIRGESVSKRNASTIKRARIISQRSKRIKRSR